MSIKHFKIVAICTFFFTHSTASNITKQQIEDLEKQKGDLYIQINKAIDESVNALKLSNDSDSVLTLNHMRELKEQIKELNATEDSERDAKFDEIENGTISEAENDNNVKLNETRRLIKNAIVSSRNKNIKLDLAEIVALLKKRGDKINEKPDEEKILQQAKIQKRIELWILEKQKEREKIKKYQLAKRIKGITVKSEKCPNFGIARGKSKTKFRRKGDKKSKKGSKSLYPCCRKCCKKSDMGCL